MDPYHVPVYDGDFKYQNLEVNQNVACGKFVKLQKSPIFEL